MDQPGIQGTQDASQLSEAFLSGQRDDGQASINQTHQHKHPVLLTHEHGHSHHRASLNKRDDDDVYGGPLLERMGGNMQVKSSTTYFIFRSWRMQKVTYIKVITVFLFLSLFLERFCFITTVYKTKYYGYVLILLVIGLNCVFNLILSRLRKKKQTKRLHELFNIERTPSVSTCVIGFIGMLDMLYAFFLFWPANVIPVWLLVTLLQFFIPLNMLVRSCCIGLQHHKIHAIAGFIIFSAVIINLLDFTQDKRDQEKYLPYAMLFLLCSLFDVVSHALKESVVRTQPLDQEKFNFKISISQFIVGLMITPAILSISQQYEDYGPDDTPLANYSSQSFGPFAKAYIYYGFNCILGFDKSEEADPQGQCENSFWYMMGYVVSIFVLQLTLTSLMQYKKTHYARTIFSFMVPITVVAFLMAGFMNPSLNLIEVVDVFDVTAIIVASVGVFVYNWFEEKPQKASIESL